MTQPITTSDGQLLSVKLKQVESYRRRTALLLVAPLLLFIIFTYIFPIASLLFRSIDNTQLNALLINTHSEIQEWDGTDLPDEAVFQAFFKDLRVATDNKEQGKIATRLNYELSGLSSLTKKTARKAKKFDEDKNFKDQFLKVNKKWGQTVTWNAIQRATVPYHGRKYLTTFDLEQDFDGSIKRKPDGMRINVTLWLRTIFVAVGVTISCLLLAFPIAHLLATLPGKYSNLLMICVLLPFWTSLLVRTSSWMVLLQTQGVLNDILVFLNIVDDQDRLVMMYNMMGTFIAMTQIL